MEYRVYNKTINKQKGRHGGKRMEVLKNFLNSGETRWDIYKYDENDTPEKFYQGLMQASYRKPFKGKVQVVKRHNIVSLNRIG